ncbi:unnamed protein product [Auanema sp. JU1783]|nr:unnamed protein product [Auanema sp. JU1783]
MVGKTVFFTLLFAELVLSQTTDPSTMTLTADPSNMSLTTDQSTPVPTPQAPRRTVVGSELEYNGPGCVNEPLQVWSDVMFVIESSGNKNNDFENMWFSVVTLSESFNIQMHGYPLTHFMQAGVVVYGDMAITVAPLGSINNLFNINPPFVGSKTGATDLADGITKAAEELTGPNSRPNAKKIIYLVADDLNTNGFNDPKQVATHFKLSGGIIIARAVKPDHGPVPEKLADIASLGYFLNENTTTADEIVALTESNCFCRDGSLPYSVTNDKRELPTAGCYVPISLQYTFQTATALCRQRHSGYIASVQTADKGQFLRSLLPGHVIWTGLFFEGEWLWQDRTKLGDYHPWGVSVGAKFDQHAMMYDNGYWYPADIKQNIPFLVCEAPPCDSVNYCEL